VFASNASTASPTKTVKGEIAMKTEEINTVRLEMSTNEAFNLRLLLEKINNDELSGNQKQLHRELESVLEKYV